MVNDNMGVSIHVGSPKLLVYNGKSWSNRCTMGYPHFGKLPHEKKSENIYGLAWLSHVLSTILYYLMGKRWGLRKSELSYVVFASSGKLRYTCTVDGFGYYLDELS